MVKKRFFSVVLIIVLQIVLICFLQCGKSKNPFSSGQPGTTIDKGGGIITTSDSITVVFPAEALADPANVWVKTISPDGFFTTNANYRRVVVSCSSSVATFARNVEIRVPYPAGLIAADSGLLTAGCIDDTSGVVTVYPVETRIIDGRTFAVLSVPHFSNWLYEWMSGPVAPAMAGPLAVPYYNQGSTGFCWATCTQMITQAAKWISDAQVNDIVGRMKIDDGGISAIQFRYSGTLAKIVKERTNCSPDRNCWDFVNYVRIKDYAKREIGVCGHPVALFMGQNDHVITLVGYNGDNFLVHDPQSTTPDEIGYTVMSWTTITNGFGLGSSMVTMVVPTPGLDPARSDISVAIASDAFRLIKPSATSGEQSMTYTEKWAFQRPSGFALFSSLAALTDTLPAGISELEQVGCVEVYNSSRTETKTISAWLDLTAVTSGSHPSYSEQVSITLPPNSLRIARFSNVSAEKFIDTLNADNALAREYLLTVRAFENGDEKGRSSFRFCVRAKVPTIKSLTPSSALPGAQVIIKGLYFGAIRNARNIVFRGSQDINGTIVSWSDTQIVVKVPANATTVTSVLIKNADGSVAGNSFPFEILSNTSPCTAYVHLNCGDADSIKIYGFNMEIIRHGDLKARVISIVSDSLDTMFNYINNPVVELFLSGKHKISISGVMHNSLSCGSHAEVVSASGYIRQVIDFDPIVFKRDFQDIGGSFTITPEADSCSFRFDFDAATDWPNATILFMGAQIRPSQHWTLQTYNRDLLTGTDTGSISYGFLQLGCWHNYSD